MNPFLAPIERELDRTGTCDLVCHFDYKGQRQEVKERVVRMPDGSLRLYAINDQGEVAGEHRGDPSLWLEYFSQWGYAVRPQEFAPA